MRKLMRVAALAALLLGGSALAQGAPQPCPQAGICLMSRINILDTSSTGGIQFNGTTVWYLSGSTLSTGSNTSINGSLTTQGPLHLNSATQANVSIDTNGSTNTYYMLLKNTTLVDSGTAVAFRFDTTNALTTTANLMEIYNGGTRAFYLIQSGSAVFAGSNLGIVNNGGATQGLSASGNDLRVRTPTTGTIRLSESGGTDVLAVSATAATFSGNVTTSSTTSPGYQCTGAAACDVRSASGQNITVDSLGGTATASIGATNATTTVVGRTGQTTTFNGAGNHDWTFSAMDPLNGVTTTGVVSKMGPTIKAAVLDDAFWVQGVAGTGGTTQTVKLCSDNACAATTFATCTPTCTSAAGTQVTCTVNTSAVPITTTLFWVITSTTCTTDSSGNLSAHFQE